MSAGMGAALLLASVLLLRLARVRVRLRRAHATRRATRAARLRTLLADAGFDAASAEQILRAEDA